MGEQYKSDLPPPEIHLLNIYQYTTAKKRWACLPITLYSKDSKLQDKCELLPVFKYDVSPAHSYTHSSMYCLQLISH